MIHKKVLRLIVLLFIAGLSAGMFAGCSAPRPERYALCMSHLTNSFTNTLADAARQRAQELGIELIVLDAQKSIKRQAGQLETLVEDGVTGIILEPAASTGLEVALTACEQAGIPVVLVTQRLRNEKTIDCFVGPDSRQSGRLQMNACVEALGGSGSIVILHGPVGSDAQILRYEGYQDVLAEHPEVRIVGELNADWSEEQAERIITNWLVAGKQFDAVVAQNDEMALGAIAALKAADLIDQVKVFGIDGSPQAMQALELGFLKATITQQTDIQGIRAVEACIALANHQPLATEVFVEQRVVSALNP